MSLRTFLVLSSLLLSFSIYGTECSDIFPGPQTFTTNSVDSIEGAQRVTAHRVVPALSRVRVILSVRLEILIKLLLLAAQPMLKIVGRWEKMPTLLIVVPERRLFI